MSGIFSLGDTTRYRLSVAARAVAATVGAYAVAALATVALSCLLWGVFAMARAEAVLTASLGSFVIFAVAAMAIFRARSAKRAWICLVIAAAPCALIALVLSDGRIV